MIAPPPEGVELKKAYGVEGQPWLFMIDKEGTVRFIYMIFVGSDTFRKNIREILGEGEGTDREEDDYHEGESPAH